VEQRHQGRVLPADAKQRRNVSKALAEDCSGYNLRSASQISIANWSDRKPPLVLFRTPRHGKTVGSAIRRAMEDHPGQLLFDYILDGALGFIGPTRGSIWSLQILCRNTRTPPPPGGPLEIQSPNECARPGRFMCLPCSSAGGTKSRYM
jgi:hypothetical protein